MTEGKEGRPDAAAEDTDPATGKAAPVAIAGIGASAGGLQAIRKFFEHVPEDSGLAWVVVVHLSPEHKSHLADLLQSSARMPVSQVTATVALEPDQVYVIPPGANLNSVDTHLRLSDLEERPRQRAPIDHFFRTLSRTHDGNAVGIILTGTGSDGTLGLREIKEKGGLAVVQDPNEAEYDGMPQSAITTGIVDHVLLLKDIPGAVLRYTGTQPRVVVPNEGEDLEHGQEQLLQKIFAQVRARTGRDFSSYKRSTLMRRIQRRMQIRQVEELGAYVSLLRESAEEVRALADEFLITVTSFFRDAHVFETLEETVIPAILKGKGPQDHVRLWSVGCATGEEAYSLAILLQEATEGMDAPPRLQVFASDLHEGSLQIGREGLYSGEIDQDIPPGRLKRFFTRQDGAYRVRKDLREMVVFAPHNLLGDPPFSRIDLISCRNLLIYLQRDIQRDVLKLFHYALNPGGHLLLGTSETADDTELFSAESKKACIYRKRNVPVHEPNLPVFPVARLRTPRGAEAPGRTREPVSYGGLHQRMVEQLAPPSLLVDQEHRVVHLSEHAGRFLVHPGGEPTSSVFKLVREELRIELRAALHTAAREGRPVRTRPIRTPVEGREREVVMQIRAATEEEHKGYFLVIFDDEGVREPADERPAPTGATEGELEAELLLMRQRLQAVIEEYETSQEEMKASNEELQSSNEELRSTMEELETSKEELQSMNEELTTVNQENRHRVEELSQLSGDLQNLLASTQIATLFLDRDLRILRFTPPVSELFNVRATDRGRPVTDLTHRLGYDELPDDAQRVLDRLVPVEREVRDEHGRTYIARVLPYRSGEDRIIGVVITFVDISARTRVEEELRKAKIYAESIVETLHEPLLVLTPDLRLQTVNQAFYHHFEVEREATIGRLIYDLGNGQWDIAELRALLEDVLPDSNVFNDYEVRHTFEDIGERVMLLNARRLDHVQLILLGIRDITEQKRAEEALRESEEKYRTLFNEMDQAYAVVELISDRHGRWSDFRFLDVNPAFVQHTGMGYPVGRTATELLGTPNPRWVEIYGEVVETGESVRVSEREPALDRTFDLNVFRFGGEGSRCVAVLFTDVTERRRAEEALRENERRFRQMAEAVPDIVFTATPDGVVDYVSPRREELTGLGPESALGTRMWPELIHPEDRPGVQARVDAALGRQEPFDARYRLQTAQGGYRWFLARGRPILAGGGEVVRWFGTLSDVDDLTRAEEAIRELNETLEARVEERTAELEAEARERLRAEEARREVLQRLITVEEDERQRISRELHDQMGQQLTGLLLGLRALREMEGEARREKLDELEALAGGIARDAQNLALELRPPALDAMGLTRALESHLEEWCERHGIDCDFHSRGVEQGLTSPEAEITLYRIAQEGLTNVLKHARASRVGLILERRDGTVHLILEDDGAGFEVDEVLASAEKGRRLGVRGMRERVARLGGDMEIESTPGTGTTLFVRVPDPDRPPPSPEEGAEA